MSAYDEDDNPWADNGGGTSPVGTSSGGNGAAAPKGDSQGQDESGGFGEAVGGVSDAVGEAAGVVGAGLTAT